MINDIARLKKYVEEYQELNKIFGNILDAPSKGGNISVKDGEYLIIKSSGEDLKRNHKISILKNNINSFSCYNGIFSTNIIKPSMEVKMHMVFKNKYVAHYHPVYILPYLCANNYNFYDYEVVDFALPGDELYAILHKNYVYKEKGIVMLKNHGVIIYAEKIQDMHMLYAKLKNDFFDQNNFIYTPDDAIDIGNFELWLFRNAIENIAKDKNLNLTSLKRSEINKLVNLPDEKYRKKIMESENIE
ncbi:class II aldolase/adducin family protein [Campylobacter insulaenigrae]|uniref:Capsular polysaccharide biosynthesis protein, putative aldolase n=1 Tax=Campylobacter insulaenigrae NCTC 12927 TaxID=1031564 RepID=A0A0A8H055_9BACT|nr:class II aldolase/adducin family protein [Campylobacter insulaenigrae]AJC87297.1 capsular polysaccharide biosynthesis protein, putative aldolase [Campylobacter insulaenigrae NCTC 12927]VEH93152.1 capsular polysaccharide biosynthesis protein, putative [Campylobacter insulaenigrae]